MSGLSNKESDHFRSDPKQRLLFRDGAEVALMRKVADMLHVLLERRGTVVEKSELLRLVWPDTQVTVPNVDTGSTLPRCEFPMPSRPPRIGCGGARTGNSP
jgi:DNA-binding winged helix-turn-helix (wHTH) protein